MNVSLVLTVIGPDRPGIVAELARLAGSCGASWQESKMARVAGQFAGIARLDVAEESYATLERALLGLEAGGLKVRLARDVGGESAHERPGIALEIVGHDRAGIVRDISAILARHRVSIDELETDVEEASMSGELLFRAHVRLFLPDDVELERLRADLEAIADELMVDLSLDTAGPGTS